MRSNHLPCLRPLLLAAGLALMTCLAAAQEATQSVSKATERGHWRCTGSPADLPTQDPRLGEVVLGGAAPSWNAFHLFTSDTWRLHAIGAGYLTHEDGSPQVIVMDEKGRCIILQGDSGKWSPGVAVEDGRSMSAWAVGDLDPRVAGEELYVGGRSGNIYRVESTGRHEYSADLVATAPGASLSRLVVADLDPARPGMEMLALTNDGPVFDVRPDPASAGSLRVTKLGDLGSRTRDTVFLPGHGNEPPRVAALLASGEVALLHPGPEGLERTPLCQEDMSIARMARRPARPGEGEVIYVARVDGLIVRFAEGADGAWTREPIYAGPNGPRGLAAGHFCADHRVETVAVFGYSRRVQLLSRHTGGPWKAQTLFTDTGGGHWLAAAELDGRNATDELVGGGFSYHVFMLTRVPGYGLGDVAVDPDGGVPAYAPGPAAATARAGGAPSRGASPGAAGPAASLLAGGKAVADALLTCGFEQDPDGAAPADWTVAETNGKGSTADWRVLEDEHAADGRKVVRIVESKNAGSTYNLLLSEQELPADLGLDVCIRPESGKEDQGGGLVWRAKDAANYYIARWNPLETNLRVYKVEKSVRSLFESCIVQCDPGAWHRLSVIMRGSRGTVFFDGKQCLAFDDDTFKDGGRAGLWSKADAASSFDGFVARKTE